METDPLDGVVVVESSISHIEDGRLFYRGYPVEAAAQAGEFAETVFLLWAGRLPTAAEVDALEGQFEAGWALPKEVIVRLRSLPATTPMMTALREGVAALALTSRGKPLPTAAMPPLLAHNEDAAAAALLVGALPAIAAQFYHVALGRPLYAPRVSGRLTQRFLQAIYGEEPAAEEARALDKALTLYAENGLVASTFAARVIAATQADVFAAVIAALSAVEGSLHGDAPFAVFRLLQRVGVPADAPSVVDGYLRVEARLPGFEGRPSGEADGRAVLFRQLALGLGAGPRVAAADAVAEAAHRRLGHYPDVDFYAAVLFEHLGFDADLASAIYALGRVAGWTAHAMEQHGSNRMARPVARYVGTQVKAWQPLAER
ncbi:MAG: citrate/2-methylcitrate synthase [Anaerolineae bacterium]